MLPGQVALGGLAVGGDEPDVDRAATVVDVDDGADVVPVEGLDSCAWSGVAGGVVECGELLDELIGADAVLVGGDAGRLSGDAELLDEFRQCPAAGEGVDAGVVGVDAVGELLGCEVDSRRVRSSSISTPASGSMPVSWRSRSGSASVVSRMRVGVGDDEPVLGDAAGQVGVGGRGRGRRRRR